MLSRNFVRHFSIAVSDFLVDIIECEFQFATVRGHRREQFLTHDWNLIGSCDAKANSISFDFENFDADVSANHNFFVLLPAENQHENSSLSILIDP